MALLIGGCIPSKDWKVHDGIYLCVFSYYEADTRAFLRSEYVLAPRSGEPRTRRDPARPTPSSVGTRSGQEDRILCGYSVLELMTGWCCTRQGLVEKAGCQSMDEKGLVT